jgi:hypothetical protein
VHPAAGPGPQAKLHERLGQRLEAAHYHRLNLERIDREGISGQDAVEALTFLADFHKARGRAGRAGGDERALVHRPRGRLPRCLPRLP